MSLITIGELPATFYPTHFRINRNGEDFEKWVPRELEKHLSEYSDLCFSVKENSVMGSILTSCSYMAFEIKLYWESEDIILEARRIGGESSEFGELYQSIIGLFTGTRRSTPDYDLETFEYTEEELREEFKKSINMILYNDPEVSLNGILNTGAIMKNGAIVPILFEIELLTILMKIVLRPEVSSYDTRIKEHAIYSLAYVARTYPEEWKIYLEKGENEFLSKLVDLVCDNSPHISKLASEMTK